MALTCKEPRGRSDCSGWPRQRAPTCRAVRRLIEHLIPAGRRAEQPTRAPLNLYHQSKSDRPYGLRAVSPVKRHDSLDPFQAQNPLNGDEATSSPGRVQQRHSQYCQQEFSTSFPEDIPTLWMAGPWARVELDPQRPTELAQSPGGGRRRGFVPSVESVAALGSPSGGHVPSPLMRVSVDRLSLWHVKRVCLGGCSCKDAGPFRIRNTCRSAMVRV